MKNQVYLAHCVDCGIGVSDPKVEKVEAWARDHLRRATLVRKVPTSNHMVQVVEVELQGDQILAVRR